MGTYAQKPDISVKIYPSFVDILLTRKNLQTARQKSPEILIPVAPQFNPFCVADEARSKNEKRQDDFTRRRV
jgi:hypothetical protein